MNLNYFLVKVMCGHVGSLAYIPVVFPVLAEDGKEAAKIARTIPRVKHHNKYAILSVKKVSYEEFLAQQEENNSDPYLNWSETGCTHEYIESVYERIVYMYDNPITSKRKKECSKRSNRDYRGSIIHQFSINDYCEC